MAPKAERRDSVRYHQLWAGLVMVRVLAASASGVVLAAAVRPALFLIGPAGGWIFPVFFCGALAIPSAASKRGRWVWPASAVSALGGMMMAHVGHYAWAGSWAELSVVIGAAGAAIGLAEGCCERHFSTAFYGALNGAFGGALAGFFIARTGDRLADLPHIGQEAVLYAAAFTLVHLGVGLGLGIGRRLVRLGGQGEQGGQGAK